ncbi:hypothetical protein [Sphingomonas sp. S2-65]|uniref:hypothetical protein n=1 Tax=Sphingomonas sp. S2-65 TaxID=2903960 RepID=UPI001F491108|nr:hypothetical protein [Sphingomonas sp. S2-65]UYY57029.1 hypothetical protein LZ586_10055 [Sphingomonas sp. S2-65]
MSNHQHESSIIAVAKAIIAGERGADTNIRNLADLVSVTAAETQRIELPPHATQAAFDQLQTAMDAAFETRKAIVAAHLQFGAIAAKLGATPTSWGDLWPCPPFPKTAEAGQEAASLRLVAAA